ncbi:MAG: methyltransferase domain-containing protein [Gemmataceae bacterium]|nr:methyltransferase domain-containing protein [Gemmataceae bacterium]MDW8264985.1 methyltransferase domain-containing protein [Gemmataceae bacterium]
MVQRSARTSRASSALPACYARVIPGLEPVAADEITRDLGGEVKRVAREIVVFRAPAIDRQLLELRTTEDVFLLAWGTDQLTYRAADLEHIRRWTAHDVDWEWLLQLHHLVRPKPRGRPTFRLVTQMSGEHGYRRRDAGEALAQGLAGKLPAAWRPAEDNADVEIWLTIHGRTAVCGLRLSDRTMRHRTYKRDHRPASLRPTLAAAMIRLADTHDAQVVLDPMCGAGTILAEQLAAARRHGLKLAGVWGGDRDRDALAASAANLRRLGAAELVCWDARRLPLPGQSVDRIISNPPFGKQLGDPHELGLLYRDMLAEYQRVLRPQGVAVLLVSDLAPLEAAARGAGWVASRQLRVCLLGQPAVISVWRNRSA